MTPEEYIAFEARMYKVIAALHNEITAARNQVDPALPANLRRATAADVKRGQIIWHTRGDFGPYWNVVCDVRYPDDAFKAYVADDGSRYGLHDAWVRIEPTAETAP